MTQQKNKEISILRNSTLYGSRIGSDFFSKMLLFLTVTLSRLVIFFLEYPKQGTVKISTFEHARAATYQSLA